MNLLCPWASNDYCCLGFRFQTPSTGDLGRPAQTLFSASPLSVSPTSLMQKGPHPQGIRVGNSYGR